MRFLHMEKTTSTISPYYLVFKLLFISIVSLQVTLFAGSPLDTYNPRFVHQQQKFDFTQNMSIVSDLSMDRVDSIKIYPGRPLIMSLLLPGAGQFYNHDSWLKIGAFAGVELTSVMAYFNFIDKANQLQSEYESFADLHWSIEDWVINTSEVMNRYPDLYSDVRIDGTHSLLLHLPENMIEEHGEFVSSDILDSLPEWGYNTDLGVTVVRDRDFYENIGKYDQFVGGWDDFDPNNILAKEKDVGDSTEVIIVTSRKNKYLNTRYDSNQKLKMANYAITALLFNHVWSAIDAVLVANKNKQKESNGVKTDVGLLYDGRTKYGIGGVSVSVKF